MREEERTLAAVSHGVSAGATLLSMGTVGWLVPLIIFFVKRRESKFIAFHALQSVYLQAGLSIASILLGIITVISFGLLSPVTAIILFLLVAGTIFFEIMAAIRAKEGKWYGIPVAGAWTRKTLGDP